MRAALAAIAVLLFSLGFWICSFVFPPEIEIEKFTDLRYNLYSVTLCLCFIVGSMKDKRKITNLFLDLGVGLSVSDVCDRLFFDITKFQTNDIIMAISTLLVSIYMIYIKKNEKDNIPTPSVTIA